MIDLEWAIQQTVLNKRGYSKLLADAIGCSQQILLNKVNPEIVTNHLSVVEASKIMQVSGNVMILEELARLLGYTLVKDDAEPVSITDALLSVMKEHGDIGQVIGEATADNVITENEQRAIVKEINDARHSLDCLESSIKTTTDK